MSRSSPIQTAFNGGVLSPRMWGRADLAKYASGCEILDGFVPLVQGPAFRRSGFRYVADAASFVQAVRLVPFEVSDDQAYVVELTNQKMRFYTLEASLLSAGSPLEVVTPYLAEDLFELQYAQSADTLFLVHPNYAPRALSRTALSAFSLDVVDFFDGPYDAANITNTTLTHAAGAAGATITIAASAAVFDATRDVGRFLRVTSSVITTTTFWGYGVIMVVNSPTSVDVLLVRDVPDNSISASRNWRLGAWYTDNYPRTVTFDDQRLVFAADPANPQVLYGSVVDDFTNFTPTGDDNRAVVGAPSPTVTGVSNEVFDTNSYRLELSANEVNVIQWIASARTLLAATTKGFWQVQASSNLEPLTPSNAHARRASDRGGCFVVPRIVDDALIFPSPTAQKFFRSAFSLNRESYVVEDLTLLADHLTVDGVVQTAWALEPHGILWCATANGNLRGLVIDNQQEIAAWFACPVGGVDAAVESVCVISAPAPGVFSEGAHSNRKHDQLWVVMRRTVDGVVRKSIEFLEDAYPDDLPIADAFFVDGGLSYAGAPATVISGLAHLEGESVQVLADGSFVGERVVVDGAITLAASAERVHVGLAYVSRLRNLRLETGDAQGSSQGKVKRTDQLTMRFHRTVGGVLRDVQSGEADEIPFDDMDVPLDTPPPFFTGDATVAVDAGWSSLGQVQPEQRLPLPMTLLCLVHRVESSPRGQ